MNYHLLLRDAVEILFYSTIIYTFCIWLKTDKTKNLLSYFLAYCGIALGAWTFELQTLTPFLFSYAPVALILFIIMHEKTLQRNLIALRSLTPAQPLQEDWLDILLSSMFTGINKNKSITIAVEKSDSLHHFLTAPFFINAVISKEILDILLTSSSYEERKIVWITAHGHIKGINATWLMSETDKQHTTTAHTLFNKANALFYSSQCDALIIHSNHLSRTFTVISQGAEIKYISSQNIKHILNKELSQYSSYKKKGPYRENNVTETSLSE